MKDYKDISDNEIRNLLKKRLLEHTDDDLFEAEAKLVFGAESVIVPAADKEKELIEKLKSKKIKFSFKKWILPGAIVITGLSVLLYHGASKINSHASSASEIKLDNVSEKSINGDMSDDQPAEIIEEKEEDTVRSNFIKLLPGSKFYGQIVENILKENADCTSPILVRDTIVFSPHAPYGSGNEMEIHDNEPNDPLYFENEHNTVWYKFSALKSGHLTFDIIPDNINDDYDFMLYKWSGGDFRAKVMNKQIQPIRTCISRNNKAIKSMTGLCRNESAEPYIHSGIGSSYVRYIQVEKGETYYLLVDNVYANGNGHTIRFHYKCYAPDELYVGKMILLRKLRFKGYYEFMPGWDEAIDSMYQFLIAHPKIKIEIQGHVNTDGGAIGFESGYTAQKVSDLRAWAVYNCLLERGIDSLRMTAVGYADTKKKIKLPKTKAEYYMNMRSEVMITSLDYKRDLELRRKRRKPH